LISTQLDSFYIHFHEDALVGRAAADVVVDEARQVHEGHLDALAGFVRGAAPKTTRKAGAPPGPMPQIFAKSQDGSGVQTSVAIKSRYLWP
jgi:hypothetical protein